MNKLYVLMGKSCTGKDTVYKKLLENPRLNLKSFVSYTTRPIRTGETNGVEYHFLRSVDEILKHKDNIIEIRKYDTKNGEWFYMTIDDGQIDFNTNHLTIGTLESYEKLREYYGESKVVPLYVEVDDGIRLQRSLDREMGQENPKYKEMCRRYLADDKDFSEARLNELNINKRFRNDKDVYACLREIENTILQEVSFK